MTYADRERVTFRLTTGQEIFVGFREPTRQKRARKPIGRPSEAAARGVIEYRREQTMKAWAEHPQECRCDDCIPF